MRFRSRYVPFLVMVARKCIIPGQSWRTLHLGPNLENIVCVFGSPLLRSLSFPSCSSFVLRQELCRRVPWLQQQISGESFNTNLEEDKVLIIPYPQPETDITQSATPGSILNFIHNFTICLCVQNKGEPAWKAWGCESCLTSLP